MIGRRAFLKLVATAAAAVAALPVPMRGRTRRGPAAVMLPPALVVTQIEIDFEPPMGRLGHDGILQGYRGWRGQGYRLGAIPGPWLAFAEHDVPIEIDVPFGGARYVGRARVVGLWMFKDRVHVTFAGCGPLVRVAG